MIRNLADFAVFLVDSIAEWVSRRTVVAEDYGIPDTWRPEHIHVADADGCTYEGGCDLAGFHFHEAGAAYRTLREYEATLSTGRTAQ